MVAIPRLSDEDLVGEALAGSSGAADELFERHVHGVYRLAYGITGDQELASDAAQDALELAFRSLGRFERRSTFGVWLHRITVNASLDQLRRSRRLRARTVAFEHAVDRRELEDRPVSLIESARILEALRLLSPPLRSVVVLRYWLDYTHEQTADILGIPLGTASTRSRRALTQLKQLLEERHEPEP